MCVRRSRAFCCFFFSFFSCSRCVVAMCRTAVRENDARGKRARNRCDLIIKRRGGEKDGIKTNRRGWEKERANVFSVRVFRNEWREDSMWRGNEAFFWRNICPSSGN